MPNPPDQVRVRLKIEGWVQGVYFRASTVQEAHRLGVTGWVMNCPDGSVEAVAEGTRARIDELIAWCRRGPPGAQVHRRPRMGAFQRRVSGIPHQTITEKNGLFHQRLVDFFCSTAIR
jgi:acylphosphatase